MPIDPVWLDVLLTGIDAMGSCSIYDLHQHLRRCGIQRHILSIAIGLKQLQRQQKVRCCRKGGILFWEINHAHV